MLSGLGTEAWGFCTHRCGANTKRTLSDLALRGVRVSLDEKGASKITQIGALEVEKLIFICGCGLICQGEQVS